MFLTCRTILKPLLTKVFVVITVDIYGVQNMFKSLRDNKIHQFYSKNGIISLKLIKNGQVKTITHNGDIKYCFLT